MTQKKNGSFQGVNFYDVEPDSISDKDTYGNIVGDLAYIEDLASGASGTIGHSGDGLGCPLNFSLLNNGHFQYLFGGVAGETSYVYSAPIYFPPGTSTYDFILHTSSMKTHFLEIYTFTNTESNTGPHLRTDFSPVPYTFVESQTFHKTTFHIDPGATGKVYFLAVRVDAEGPAGDSINYYQRYHGFHVYAANTAQNTSNVNIERRTNSYPVATESSGGATIKKTYPLDEDLFAADLPITGHVLTRVNREQNALTEYLTGAPAGDNETLSLADSATSNPSTSAFYSHKPGGANGYGVFMNLATYGTSNMNKDWNTFYDHPGSAAPGSVSSGSQSNRLLQDIPMYCPDLNTDNSTSSTTRLCTTWICTEAISPAINITVETIAYNVSNSSAGTYTATLTVGNPGIYTCWVLTPNIHEDIWNRIRIQYDLPAGYPGAKSGVSNIPTVALLGATYFIRPT